MFRPPQPIILISIHSPRMGRDPHPDAGKGRPRISIHSPRMGRDMAGRSRPPLPGDFNPLSPHRERPCNSGLTPTSYPISIHSPRMGRDSIGPRPPQKRNNFNPLSPHGERTVLVPVLPPHSRFQSTLPAWGETRKRAVCMALGQSISIHSPRMGRDGKNSGAANRCPDFNPLSPHGERRYSWAGIEKGENFNPLSPHGERLWRKQ